MTEKTNKIKLPKYSSYLTDNDSSLLDSFCTQFDCSKAKALPLLLKFWNDNKNKVSNELATISIEDISSKKYDERLATIEDKLANISYDTELATIKDRLATLENMLATIANEDLSTIDSELIASDSLSSPIQSDNVSDINQPEENAQIEDITEGNALLESPILPVKVDSEVIVPNEEKSDNNSDIPLIDNKIKTFEDAIKKILELKSEGKTNTAIAKELTGKYHTAKGMTDWKDIQVKRVLQKLENNGTDTPKEIVQ